MHLSGFVGNTPFFLLLLLLLLLLPSRPLSFSLRPPPPSSLFGVNVVRTIFLNYYSLLSTCNGNNWECGGENRATKHVLTEGNLACFQRCQPFQNMCEQVLFVRFYNNPAPLNGSMQFHYCTLVTRETGADDAFVLKRGVWRNATWPSHSRPAIAASARLFQICFSPLTF